MDERISRHGEEYRGCVGVEVHSWTSDRALHSDKWPAHRQFMLAHDILDVYLVDLVDEIERICYAHCSSMSINTVVRSVCFRFHVNLPSGW